MKIQSGAFFVLPIAPHMAEYMAFSGWRYPLGWMSARSKMERTHAQRDGVQVVGLDFIQDGQEHVAGGCPVGRSFL